VQFTQRDACPADVGRARVGQQTGLEHHRGEPERRVAGHRVEGGDPHEVPQCLDGTLRLTVRGQPAAEVLRVERRIGEVEPLERQSGTPDLGTLGERQMRISSEAARQMQWYGQCGTADSAEPPSRFALGVENGHIETILQGREFGSVDAVEEPAVRGAAAQIHMLAVVHGEPAALEGEGEPAQARPAFEQRHPHSGVGERERRRDTGEPPADHYGRRRATKRVRVELLCLRGVVHRAPSPEAPPR
jgi:hypothetical protein